MKCSMCDNKKSLKKKKISKYLYKDCGLNNVILHNLQTARCDQCGEVYFHFGNPDELHRLIAHALIKKGDLLTGKELRFLRKYLGYSSMVFSKLVGYKVEHLSRLENGKALVQEVFDRLVRLLILERAPDQDYHLQDLFLEGKLMKIEWLEFSLSPQKKWRLKKIS